MASGITVRRLVTVLGYDVEDAEIKKAIADVDRYVSSANRAAAATNTWGSGLRRLAVRFAAGVGAAMFGRAVLNTGVAMENLHEQLVTLTGSTEAAVAQQENLLELTSDTPNQVNQVTQAYADFAARGLDASNEALTRAGDLAAAFSLSINDASRAVSSAAFGEAEALKRFGFIIRQEGNRTSISLRGNTRMVERDSRAIQSAILEMANAEFGGAMIRQMNTLGGVISNLKDNVMLFFAAIGEAGVNDALRELIGGLRDVTGESRDFARTIGKGLGTAIRMLSKLLQFAVEHADKLKAVLLVIAGFLVYQQFTALVGVVGRMALAFGAAATKILLADVGMKSLAATTLSWAAIIAGLLLAIPILIQDFIVWTKGGDSLIGRFVERFRGEDGLMGTLADLAMFLRNEGPQLWEDFTASAREFGEVASSAVNSVKTVVEGVARTVASIGGVHQLINAQARIDDLRESSEEVSAEQRRLGGLVMGLAHRRRMLYEMAGFDSEDATARANAEVRDTGLYRDFVAANERITAIHNENASLRRQRILIEQMLAGNGGLMATVISNELLAPQQRSDVALAGPQNNLSVGQVSVTVENTRADAEGAGAAAEQGVLEALNGMMEDVERASSAGTGAVYE